MTTKDKTYHTPLAPVEWLDYLDYVKIGNGWEIELVTNDGRRFKIGYLIRYKNTNQYILLLEWLNCVPSIGAWKWVLERVEQQAKTDNIRLYNDSGY